MCGDDPRLVLCASAQAAAQSDGGTLEEAVLPPTASLGTLRCKRGDASVCRDDEVAKECRIEATTQLNVIDVDKIQLGEECELILDGQGIENVVFILRTTRVQTRAKARITLVGGATPGMVLLGDGDARKCQIGVNNQGAGTLFCPNANKVKISGESVWEGAVVGGKRVELGDDVDLIHYPFFGLAARKTQPRR